MSFISRVGRKLQSVGRYGGKLLSRFGRVGQKVTGGIKSVMDTVERLPLVGDLAKKNKVYQGMRGIVAGAAQLSKGASKAGQILEATPGSLKGVYQTAGKLKNLGTAGRGDKNPIMGNNVSGQNTLAAQAKGIKQAMSTRTNTMATGNISVGNESNL
jgi:hypothetical protein